MDDDKWDGCMWTWEGHKEIESVKIDNLLTIAVPTLQMKKAMKPLVWQDEMAEKPKIIRQWLKIKAMFT